MVRTTDNSTLTGKTAPTAKPLPYASPARPPERRLRLGVGLIRLLMAVAVAVVFDYGAAWGWFASLGFDDIPSLMPDHLPLRAAGAGLLIWAASLAAECRPGIVGALLAVLPAGLIPLTDPLSRFLLEFVRGGDPNASWHSLLAFMAIFGTLTWVVVLLDAVLPRWGGIILGGIMLLGVTAGYYVAAGDYSPGFLGPQVHKGLVGMQIINGFMPVWVPYLALRLTRRVSWQQTSRKCSVMRPVAVTGSSGGE